MLLQYFIKPFELKLRSLNHIKWLHFTSILVLCRGTVTNIVSLPKYLWTHL